MSWKCPSCGNENTDDTSLRCYCGFDQVADPLEDIKKSKNNKLRIWFWVGEIVSICLSIFCILGYIMAAWGGVAAPEQKNHWENVAVIYGVGVLASLILAIVFAILMFKYRKK